MVSMFEEMNSKLTADEIIKKIKVESPVISQHYSFNVKDRGNILERVVIISLYNSNLSISLKPQDFRDVFLGTPPEFSRNVLRITMISRDTVALYDSGIIFTGEGIQLSYL